jgi:hypothetical protein
MPFLHATQLHFERFRYKLNPSHLKQVYEDVGQADEIFYTKRIYAVKHLTAPDEDRDEDHTCGHPLSVLD